MKIKVLKTAAVSVCVCLILAAYGCSESDAEFSVDYDLVGEWTEDIFDSGYIFNEDLTGEDTFWLLPFTYTAHDGILTITYDDDMWGESAYTYEISDDVLTLTAYGRPTFSYTRK